MGIESGKINYGGDMMLFINAQPIAFSSAAKLDISLKTRDIGSKDSGYWDEKAAGKMAWTASSDALMSEGLLVTLPVVLIAGAASITAGANTLTVVGAGFVAGDVGRTVQVIGAGIGGVDLVTTISGYTSATVVTLASNAATTLTAVANAVKWNVVAATAAITAGTNVLTMGTATFTSALVDIGKSVTIIGAGVAGADLVTTITGFTSTSVVTLAVNASTTVVATANKLVYNTSTSAYSGLYNAMLNRQPISLVFASVTGTAPSWTVAAGKTKFSGFGFITSLSLNAPDGDSASYSVSIEGTGALAMI